MMKFLPTLLLCVAAAHAKDPAASIPAFADLCGVQVGYDTLTTMERQIGRGLPSIGGHPHGGRDWRVPQADCSIYVDAFYWTDRRRSDGGKVLAYLSLTQGVDDAALPVAHLPRKQTRFMGVVSLGMSKSDVLRALRGKLPPPKDPSGDLTWEANGFVRVSRLNNYTNSKWRATLRFEGETLKEILIECPPR